MTPHEVREGLEDIFPPRYAESWDNVGWAVQPLKQPVDGILVTVDVTLDVLEHAHSHDLNLVVSHHPPIFDALDRLVPNRPADEIIMEAIRGEIALYSAHTNADSMPGGLNDYLSDLLGLRDRRPIRQHEEDPGAGLGRVGALSGSRSIDSIVELLEDELGLSHAQILGDPATTVERVGLCSGSGGDFISPSLADDVELYITGDIGHHDALEAKALGLPLLMLDHYEMETVFLPLAKELLQDRLGTEDPVRTYRRDNPYVHRIAEP